jgi:hypothetical protein
MSCAWVLADARATDARDLTRQLGLLARQSADAWWLAIFHNVNRFGAPTVLLHCHEHGFMPLHD